MTRLRLVLITLAVLTTVAAVTVVSCGHVGSSTDPDAGEAQPHPRPTWSFYQPPAPMPSAPPGTLIRSTVFPAGTGVSGWRILYHSRSASGADVAVSGVVLTPATPPPDGGRPVVAWAHGTYGSGDSCAPSTDPDPLSGIEDGRALLAAGDAIVASDYQGVGTPGPHPYLVGASEAYAVLDAARAARNLPQAGIGTSVVVFGHSEGGHAALFAGALAASYAPDLDLLGVAAAAPPTDLPALAAHVTGLDYGTAYLLWVAAGLAAADPTTPLSALLTPRGASLAHLVEDSCADAFVNAFIGVSAQDVFTHDPRTTRPWSSALAANSTPTLPPTVPTLIMQGGQDPIIVPAVTDTAIHTLCAAGDTVDYQRYPQAAHNVIPSAADYLNTWLTHRFHHDPAPSTC